MAEKSKFGGLARLRDKPDEPASVPLLPEKAPKPPGKRSDPAWKQFSLLLKKDSQEEALIRLKKHHKGNDFSDLMQALLDQWLRSE
jgi:hypothetical protein